MTEPRRVLIAGASGLIGQALVSALRAQGHVAVRLVRRAATSEDEIQWDPARGELDPAALTGVDAVVNLSGANVAAGRWTAGRRELILRSRVDATRTLVEAMREREVRPEVFVSASATGFFGERGDEILTEESASGAGFLAEVCRAWEAEAENATRHGIRTARVRFGVVLSPAAGALAKLEPIFRLGLGGRVGDGKQWMSWISIDDAVGAIVHAIAHAECEGALNVVAPEPVRNAEFTKTLAGVLHRPAFLPVPAVALHLAFGQMANETLLASTRAIPKRLQASAYEFQQPTLERALRHVLRAGKVGT